MKNNLLCRAAAACLVFLYAACSKDPGDAGIRPPTGNLCGSSASYNADFSKIDANTTYNDLFKLFLAAGDNYQTAVTNYDTIEYYRWYPCADSANYLECDLEGGRMLMTLKTFSDTSCSKNVSVAGFDSVKTGMSFADVQTQLNGMGDNFRNDYEMPGNYLKTAYYRFNDCSDTARHIDVQFSPVSGVTRASKSF